MQCFWFLTESAEANHRTKNYCMALKYYYKIDTIFSEINDDQFDFHSYSIRKCILRAYSDLIAFEDRLPNHPYFRRATLGMIQTLLDMHFEESNCLSRSMEELALIDVEKSGLEERSRKLVANAIVASNKMNEAKDSKVVNESKIEIDQDPLGLSYLKLDKLSEALRFSKIVTNYSPKCLEGWIASTHIFLAKGFFFTEYSKL